MTPYLRTLICQMNGEVGLLEDPPTRTVVEEPLVLQGL